jgi:diaminohydroxyphosphoribosylaminopyrimidine deaminase/5-amino-6-(5-phosphoribosylamino)uracil reductase
LKKEYTQDEHFMQRCLDLAKKGLGKTYPNPLVGSVIVYQDKIIGEGWHQKAGTPHAEVFAIASVQDKSLLKEATLYVNLEPCNHYGKTPPCAQLIVEHQIPRIVIGCIDPFEQVNGSGVKTLEKAGIKVTTAVLEEEAKALNKRFFTFHQKKRPYLILKWAQSQDGFIAPLAETRNKKSPVFLSSKEDQILVHQWRSEEESILIGAETAVQDNPQLTARWVEGNHPARIIIDPKKRLPKSLKVFDATAPSHQLTFTKLGLQKNTSPQAFLKGAIDYLYHRGYQSVFVEGGRNTLQHFIDLDLWDEARIFCTTVVLKEGVLAPQIEHLKANPMSKGLTILLQQQKPL